MPDPEMSYLGAFLDSYSLFQRNGEGIHLQNAIRNGPTALSEISSESPNRITLCLLLVNLSTHVSNQNFDLVSLKNAIEYSQEAVDLTPKGNPNRFALLNNISLQLSIRYSREGKQEDLTRAIEYSQEAIDLIPRRNPNRAAVLITLGNHLSIRYRREGKQEDLIRAIEYGQEAIDLTPTENSDRAARLDTLSNLLCTRYRREGKQVDLTQAIEYGREAIDLTPTDKPGRAARLNTLSYGLYSRYEREGKQEDLIQAIEYGREAVNRTPKGNPNRAAHLTTLSHGLCSQYEREGKQEDLTQAIEYNQEIVDLITTRNPNRASSLNNLSNVLCSRYSREGKQEDLTQAIAYSREAIDLTPEKNPDRISFISNLSISLSKQYERNGRQEDLTQAIEYSREVIGLTSIGDPQRAARLGTLSTHLSTRYEREGRQEDLMKAIDYSQEAVNLIPKGNPDRIALLNTLSSCLSTLYERDGKLGDLTQAIEYCQEAVDLTLKRNPDRASSLNNLSCKICMRYIREETEEDLAQIIEYSREAIDLTPKGNPNRAAFLTTLSGHLSKRYQREGKQEDLVQAIKCSREACEDLNSPPSLRLLGCRIAVDLLTSSQRWEEAQNLLKDGLKILPFLISHLSSKLDQEHMMKSISGLAATGCAVSLQCNNDGYHAIEILESGRGTINRLTINSRNDLSPLFESYPQLAKRFEDLRILVNAPSESMKGAGKTISARSTLVSELNELISEVRTKEGFENFQAPSLKDQLLETAAENIRVFLNTTHFRTDAIIVHGNGNVQTLPLKQSVFQNSSNYFGKLQNRFGYNDHGVWAQSNAEMRNFLEWLWDQVVEPVFNAFKLEPLKVLYEYDSPVNQIEANDLSRIRNTNGPRCPESDQLVILQKLMKKQPSIASSANPTKSSGAHFRTRKATTFPYFPRVHWIGVGHLGAFPFHAAGYGSRDIRKNTMSCVISSYASTLTALAFAERKWTTLEPSASKLLLVTMPRTPNESDLPGVAKEAKIIQETAKNLATVEVRELASVQVVLNELPIFNAVHFACHGHADPDCPFQGGLLLCGEEPEKSFDENTKNSILTVESISSVKTENSQLAFLSACCTAENASSLLMDEGIHLASGFQLSGFPHVIASLWETDDELSVTIAEKFYQITFARNNKIGHEKVAYALHDAVLAARRVCDDPLSWATTVHFGP